MMTLCLSTVGISKIPLDPPFQLYIFHTPSAVIQLGGRVGLCSVGIETLSDLWIDPDRSSGPVSDTGSCIL